MHNALADVTSTAVSTHWTCLGLRGCKQHECNALPPSEQDLPHTTHGLASTRSCVFLCMHAFGSTHARHKQRSCGRVQVESQLEAEKAALLERKRREQAERRRTQEELTRILDDNRRKAGSLLSEPVALQHLAVLSCVSPPGAFVGTI